MGDPDGQTFVEESKYQDNNARGSQNREILNFDSDEKIVGIKGEIDSQDRLIAFSFISFKEKAVQRR